MEIFKSTGYWHSSTSVLSSPLQWTVSLSIAIYPTDWRCSLIAILLQTTITLEHCAMKCSAN